MKKLKILLLFISILGYGQIDKNLIKNLEEITVKTELATFFKGLPFDDGLAIFNFYDERFLRFYDVIIDQVAVGYEIDDATTMMITPFNENEDYEKIKKELNKVYVAPKFVKKRYSMHYEWKNDARKVVLEVYTKNDAFMSFDSLIIYLYQ